ncbi:MAG TPA: TonB-dependent receptor [Usitatibacter sp.]|nr:TonB-dependent receptor [Usitatibacter sp.]
MTKKKNLPLACGACILAVALPCAATAAASASAADLTDLTLEQLADIVVTSASRHPEKLIEAPASIFVITAEDIRRSGATNIVQALRLAPNLFVGLGDANQAVVGARGQYAGTSNKMLVLVDGRTIYTPLFSGVFWDAQLFMIEDIERIEVISGPAATLWGSNGVNGVISISTKSAAATRGSLVAAYGGNDERGAAVRQGGDLAGEGAYRIYARYRDSREDKLDTGAPAHDASERMTAGFRADWSDRAMLNAEVYKGGIDNLAGDRPVSGGHLLGRWSEPFANDSVLRVTTYYDRTEREHIGSFQERLDLFDADMQYETRPLPEHTVVAGAGYRYARDDIVNTPVIAFAPERGSFQWANVFLQDEWKLTRTVELTSGLKAERNPYTGTEWLPNLRLSWSLSAGHFAWAALSRAVRAPSRIDRDAFSAVLRTNDTFKSEVANVAELGYRAQLSPTLNFSATAFYQRYPNLRSEELTPDGRGVIFANGFEGRSHGFESWATWLATPRWKLTGGFTLLSERFQLRPGFTDLGGVGQISNDPRHTALIRSSWDLGREWEADITVRNVGRIPNYNVPAHTAMDARVAWRVRRDLEVALTAADISNGPYAEFGPPGARAVFDRAYLVQVRWQP